MSSFDFQPASLRAFSSSSLLLAEPPCLRSERFLVFAGGALSSGLVWSQAAPAMTTTNPNATATLRMAVLLVARGGRPDATRRTVPRGSTRRKPCFGHEGV